MKIMEQLLAGDYEVYKQVNSRIDPTKTVSVFDHWRCPRCSEKFTEELRHLEPFMCGACGLVMTMKGSILECEAEVEA